MIKVREDMSGWKMWEHGVPESRLTVIGRADDYVNPHTGKRMARWICECSCSEHNKVIACGSQLRNGNTKSCGCLQREKATARNLPIVDMTNWKMWEHGIPDSKITVIQYLGRKRWLCECNCEDHTRFEALGTNVRRGSVKSCGCMRSELISQANKKYNNYQIHEDIMIGFTEDGNQSFVISTKDYDIIKNYYWYVDTHGYVVTRNTDGKYIRMHRLIMGAQDNELVDHIDRNRSNNVRENLRITNAAGNAINHNVRKNNLSNISGVTWYEDNQKWRAFVILGGKNKYVYYGDSKEDAIRARLKAELKYYGEFAPQKHLFEKYGIGVDGE